MIDGEAAAAGCARGPGFRSHVALAGAVIGGCLLSGCGGTAPGARIYSLSRTEACLNRAGERAIAVKNSVLPGSQGNLQVAFGQGTGDIDMVFGRNAVEARAIEKHGVAIAAHDLLLPRKTLLSYVRLQGNVFYYSPQGPVSMIVNSKITACLK